MRSATAWPMSASSSCRSRGSRSARSSAIITGRTIRSRWAPAATPSARWGPMLGSYIVGSAAKAIGYDTTWQAARLGLSGGYQFDYDLTFTGEVAWVPYAHYSNADSHFQRVDLGPVPNIASTGHGMGVEAQSFVNYALTPSFEIGFGARYWGLFASNGS